MKPFSRNPLSPRLIDRTRAALRPGWIRAVLVRRTAAVGMVLVAVVIMIVDHRESGAHTVVVAAHDLRPGFTIAATDLDIREVPGELIPTGTPRMRGDVVGHTTAGPIRAGEIITDARLLSPRLPGQLTGRTDARLVPIHLADQTTAELLREGDVVDVLAASEQRTDAGEPLRGEVLARDAVVALTSGASTPGSLTTSRSAARPVLLAMGESAAHRVAAAGLDASLAVVVH